MREDRQWCGGYSIYIYIGGKQYIQVKQHKIEMPEEKGKKGEGVNLIKK